MIVVSYIYDRGLQQGEYIYLPLLDPKPEPVAVACPVNTFNSPVPVPVPVADPPFCALAIPTC